MSSPRFQPSATKVLSWSRGFFAALTCLLLIASSGCRIPGLYQADPMAPLPDTWNGVVTEENSGQVGIYEFFDDLTLAQLLTDGLAQNQELKIRN